MYFLLKDYKPLNEDEKGLYAVLDSKDFSVDFISWEDLKRIIVMGYAKGNKSYLMHKEDYVIWDKFPSVTWRGEFPVGMSLEERIEYIINDDYHWRVSSRNRGENSKVVYAENNLDIQWLSGKYSIDDTRLRHNYRGIEFNYLEFASSVGLEYESVKLKGVGFIHSRSVISMQLTNIGWNSGVDTVIDIDLDINSLEVVRLLKRRIKGDDETILMDKSGDIKKYIARLKLSGEL